MKEDVGFWEGIYQDLLGLLNPFIELVKGIGRIFAKLFGWLADLISGWVSGGGAQ